ELVRVVDDVAHLVAQVAKDVRAVESFDVADLLAVQGREIGMRQIERNADDDRAERHAPFGRQVKAGHDAQSALRELPAKLVDDGLQPRARDLEAEVANRRTEEVRFTKTLRRGHGRQRGSGVGFDHSDTVDRGRHRPVPPSRRGAAFRAELDAKGFSVVVSYVNRTLFNSNTWSTSKVSPSATGVARCSTSSRSTSRRAISTGCSASTAPANRHCSS